jgi:hypothetical protein
MGLLNKRTIDKAKRLALQNKDKIADGVGKATDVLDKKTGGKHRDKLKKVDDAAAKFAGRTPADDADDAAAPTTDATSTDEDGAAPTGS